MEYVEVKSAPAVERELAKDVLDLAGYVFGIPTENVSIKWLGRPVLDPSTYDKLRRRRVVLDAGEIGHVLRGDPSSIWLVTGLPAKDLAATVAHELAHVGQYLGGHADPTTDEADEREARTMEESFMRWLEE
jgi:hypothetical protein